jgi:hypothetical protein
MVRRKERKEGRGGEIFDQVMLLLVQHDKMRKRYMVVFVMFNPEKERK